MQLIKSLVGRLLGLGLLAAGVAGAQSSVALEVGDAAPDFSLPASDGKTYTLGQYKGVRPVVIAFFPKAFTGG
jgi:peroxiredoxin Q/BCP